MVLSYRYKKYEAINFEILRCRCVKMQVGKDYGQGILYNHAVSVIDLSCCFLSAPCHLSAIKSGSFVLPGRITVLFLPDEYNGFQKYILSWCYF